MKDPVVQEGAPVLRKKAAVILKKDIGSKKLNALIQKMKDVLSEEEFGVAIAAPQVGSSLRMFVVAQRAFKDEEGTKNRKHDVFINPHIKSFSKKKKEMEEGCLSVRGKYGTVVRHIQVTIEALDERGNPFSQKTSGLLAHIFQHEVDHLNGILFIDKAVLFENNEETDNEQ